MKDIEKGRSVLFCRICTAVFFKPHCRLAGLPLSANEDDRTENALRKYQYATTVQLRNSEITPQMRKHLPARALLIFLVQLCLHTATPAQSNSISTSTGGRIASTPNPDPTVSVGGGTSGSGIGSSTGGGNIGGTPPRSYKPAPGTAEYEPDQSPVGSARFGCRYVGVREWTSTKEGVTSETSHPTFESPTGSTYPSEDKCRFAELLRWSIHPVGIVLWMPVAACLIFFLLGVARIVLPGKPSGSSLSRARKDETRSMIDAYRAVDRDTATEENLRAVKLSSEWISSIENWIDRLETEELSQIKRAGLLQGLSMIVFSLAITIGLQGLGTIRNAAPLGDVSIAAVLLIVTPFSILVVASGFLVVQASRANAERSNLRAEQNTAEVLLLQSLSKLSKSIDFDGVFQHSRKVTGSNSHAADDTDTGARVTGTAKDLAVILSYLNKG